MLALLSNLFNVAHATMETVVSDAVSSTINTLTNVFTTNIPVIIVFAAGVVGLYFVWRLVRKFVK
jgi:hypothetical protein